MSSSKMENLTKDLAEVNKLHDLAGRQRIKDLLSIEARKIQTEMSNLREQLGSSGDGSAKVVPQRPKCYDVKISNYAWDESDKFVKVFITLKDVHTLSSDKVSCSFTKKSMDLCVKELENRNYLFGLNNLLNEINPDKSYWKVKTDMVVVYLPKMTEGQKWKYLTASDKAAKDPKAPDIPPVDPQEDPSAAMINMLKKMYDEGNDDMKRSIAKAWSESSNKQPNF